MRIVCTSDFHWEAPPDVPECDILVVAGDVLDGNLHRLGAWLSRVPAGEIVGIAGNHDRVAAEPAGDAFVRLLPWTYLNNESAVVGGLRVFGSPFSTLFGNWAFMAPEDELEAIWSRIPDDTELLVVHGPARGVLDLAQGKNLTGSIALRERLAALPALRLLVTGHIHEAYGETALPFPDAGGMRWLRCVNASRVDERYRPVNPPIIVDLEDPVEDPVEVREIPAQVPVQEVARLEDRE